MRTTLEWACPPGRADELVGSGRPFELIDDEAMGVEHRVFARRLPHLRALLVEGGQRYAGRPYLVDGDTVITFDEAVSLVGSTAAALRDEHGIGRGDRVAIAAANRYEHVVVAWAVAVLGAVLVELNGWWTGAELEYGIELAEPDLLIGDAPRLERLAGRVSALDRRDLDEACGGWFARAADQPDLPDAAIDEDDPFVVLFTSGTTGRSKGAVLTHRNNLHWIQSIALRTAARGVVPSESCEIAALPLFHISGLNCQAIASVATGTKLVYMPPPGRWTPEAQLRLSAEHRVTAWRLVPTQAWRLLECPDLGRYDLSSLRSVVGGGALWSQRLLERVADAWPQARAGIVVGLGMTETNGTGTSALMPDVLAAQGVVGGPPPAAEARVCAPGTDVQVDDGERGELQVRSASVFVGYLGDDDATEQVLGPDRWYRTGDFGRIIEGRFVVDGRRSDLIIRAGENIYPREIEDRLREHPAVADAAVVGRDHDTLGAEPVAFVVARPGSELDDGAVRAWVAETLAPFKMPVAVEFLDRLPRNATGKVMNHLLAAGADVPYAED